VATGDVSAACGGGRQRIWEKIGGGGESERERNHLEKGMTFGSHWQED